MKVVLIGSGNVATVLGKMIINSGHIIAEVVGRNEIAVENLATIFHANAVMNIGEMISDADLYIICVSDDWVSNIAQQIIFQPKLLVHTAGAVSKDVLKNIGEKYGVLYPLQSLRKELEPIPEIPFLVEGNNENATHEIVNFAKTISKNVSKANENERLKLHAAAVIVSNFTNHLFALTKDFCEKQNVDFKLLFPLIKETVLRIENNDAAEMQTGPALRKDEATMKKHLALLDNEFYLKKIYALMSESIADMYK